MARKENIFSGCYFLICTIFGIVAIDIWLGHPACIYEICTLKTTKCTTVFMSGLAKCLQSSVVSLDLNELQNCSSIWYLPLAILHQGMKYESFKLKTTHWQVIVSEVSTDVDKPDSYSAPWPDWGHYKIVFTVIFLSSNQHQCLKSHANSFTRKTNRVFQMYWIAH